MTSLSSSKYTYLRTMSAEDLANADTIVDKCISHLPFTFAFPLKRFFECLKNEEYERGKNYCFDFFEMSILWLSALLLKRLIDKHPKGTSPDKALNGVLDTIDTKRSLGFGDSLNSIFIPLVNLARKEMKDDALVKAITAHLMNKTTCILLGNNKEPSIVKLRNEYRGHGTTLAEELYKNVIWTIEPRLLTFLKALEPLAESITFSAHNGKILNHNGAETHILEKCEQKMEDGHYYIQNGDMITDLYPLIYCSDNYFVYVFQTLRDEKIVYISANENALNNMDDTNNDAFDRLFQRIKPSFDIIRDINWEEICEMASAGSKKILSRAYNEKKYNRELFVDRVHLSESFKRFSDCDKTIFPLLGEAGQGKTCQICHWVENLLERKEGVLFMQSADFTSTTLENHLKLIFNISARKNIGSVIDNIHEKAVQAGHYLYIFFDAINECISYAGDLDKPGPLGLYNDIAKLFANKRYTNFKILFTCRNYTWKHMLNRESERHSEFIFRDNDDEVLVVRGFTNDELKHAYSAYRKLYQMDTDFDKLAPIAKIRLKDPLILKITCTNYLSRALPEDTRLYTSISLFGHMLNDITLSYAGRTQRDIIERIGTYILNHYEEGHPIDNISVNMLRKAYNDTSSSMYLLSQLIYKYDGTTVAYGELINKPERPILRVVENDSGESQIQFIYERFLEYIMGLIFVERERCKLAPTEPIPAKRYIEVLDKSTTNAVFMGAMRNAMVIDIIKTHSYQTIIELTRDHSNHYEARSLVNDLCNVLVSENYEHDLFALIGELLSPQIDNEDALIREFNETVHLMQNNLADTAVIARNRALRKSLMPVLNLRKLAIINTINGIFLTDYFYFDLYCHNPYDLLWRLMNDPIEEVGNDACMYTYYLSNRNHTMNYTPLDECLTEKVVRKMYDIICQESVVKSFLISRQRKRMLSLIETAVRLSVMLIIDTSNSQEENREEKMLEMLNDVRNMFSHITFNGRLVRLIMPFLKIVLRKQITFQSDYVNNAIEYQCFWQEDVVPRYGAEGVWSREQLRTLLPLINYATASEEEREAYAPLLNNLHTALTAAYRLGDSFSYFVLERMMVIIGVRDWPRLRPIIKYMLSDEYREKTMDWLDYSQMSLLYVLYQIGVYGSSHREVLDLYASNAEDWTRRCVGSFQARNCHRANASGRYKRNVMSWYCIIYCYHIGDGNVLEGDKTCVPLFYKLIDEAIDKKDKRLLAHLIENISEIVTDWKYINTALQLLHHIMSRFDSEEKVSEIDSSNNEINSIVVLIGNVLSTAKNYAPEKVDNFIRQEIIDLPFPGVSTYKEDILNYNPSEESLSDLLTHKFGNFLMRSLLNEKYFSNFAYAAINPAIDKKDCFQWYDYAIKLLFHNLFNVKV